MISNVKRGSGGGKGKNEGMWDAALGCRHGTAASWTGGGGRGGAAGGRKQVVSSEWGRRVEGREGGVEGQKEKGKGTCRRRRTRSERGGEARLCA